MSALGPICGKMLGHGTYQQYLRGDHDNALFCASLWTVMEGKRQGDSSKTCRYCEGRVTMSAFGSMPLCVTTHTATYI